MNYDFGFCFFFWRSCEATETRMSIELEILKANYQEHFKYAKELSFIYPIEHPKRIFIEKNLNELQINIQKQNEKEKNN